MGVASVTGAARALGAVIAGRLAGDGWALTINDLPGMVAAAEDVAAGTTAAVGADMTDFVKSPTLLTPRPWLPAMKTAGHGRIIQIGPHNITVNLVAPGWIPVERHADATAEELSDYLADVPLPRIGTPTTSPPRSPSSPPPTPPSSPANASPSTAAAPSATEDQRSNRPAWIARSRAGSSPRKCRPGRVLRSRSSWTMRFVWRIPRKRWTARVTR